MIFSKFFKSSWQHKDSNVRISAINNELDINNTEHKQILLNLLNQDENELVRRAALLKLADFSIWLDASLNNSHKKIRAYALAQVELIVFDQHAIKLSEQDKLALLSTNLKTSFLESWLKVEHKANLVVAIFEKLSKPQLLVSTFNQHQQADVQLALIHYATTQEQLEKLLKKSQLAEVSQEITSRIQVLKAQAEKPVLITKQAQLILAKYLALKDVADYQEVVDKKEPLISEWQSVNQDFDCLAEEESQQLTQKFDNITEQLTKIFAQKAEAFEQQKIIAQLEQDKVNAKQEIEASLLHLNQMISDSVYQHNTIDNENFSAKTDALNKLIEHSLHDEATKKTYHNQLVVINNKLLKLPEIAQSVTEATHLISKISQLTLPETLKQLNEKYSDYQAWQATWHAVDKKAEGFLPESIMKSYHEICRSWNEALKPLNAEQKKNFLNVQRMLLDVKRLVNTGKYNAAFGVFKKAEKAYLQLNDKQQFKLQKEYLFAQEKISELSDWEHYIATPRKQELLAQVKLLVESPLDNPSEQADQVKAARAKWNSLGHADDALEEELNHEFNLACEQAFAPCRLFYAEQEKLREQHLIVRLALMDKLSEFSEQLEQGNVEWKVVESTIQQLAKNWREAGEIERSKYQQLNTRFNQLVRPIKSALKQYHQKNINEKQQLITQAERSLEQNDIELAVNEVKSLQARWRDIGHCGAREENTLWQKFRELNDQVFAKRASQYQAEKQLHENAIEQYLAQIHTIRQHIEVADSVLLPASELNQYLLQLDEIKNNVHQENLPKKKILKAIGQVEQTIEKQISLFEKRDRELQWQLIFGSLEGSINGDMIELASYQKLSAQWQKRLANLPDTNVKQQDRQKQTIIMEIIAGVDSPQEDKDLRLALQVSLMQEQLNSGESFNLESAFNDWLSLGKLSSQDLVLLTRIKSLFITDK